MPNENHEGVSELAGEGVNESVNERRERFERRAHFIRTRYEVKMMLATVRSRSPFGNPQLALLRLEAELHRLHLECQGELFALMREEEMLADLYGAPIPSAARDRAVEAYLHADDRPVCRELVFATEVSAD